jgi:hypothetical protein
MDENQEQELIEMEKALSEPEEADNTTETKTEEPKVEAEAETEETEEVKEEEETPEEPDDEDDEEAPRNPKVPYKKYKIEREKRKELESTLSAMKADIEAIKNSTSTDQKDEIEKLAEEYGVDPAFAKKLSDSITSKIKSPISDEELEMLRETKLEKEQDLKFDKEFNELLEVNPEAKEHKKKLKELAFNPKYSGKNFKPLYYIFGKEIKANTVTKTKTAEPSSTKKVDSSVIDYANMTEADAIKQLPPDKFLEWAEYQSTNKA